MGRVTIESWYFSWYTLKFKELHPDYTKIMSSIEGGQLLREIVIGYIIILEVG